MRADLVKKEVFSRNRFPKSIGNINADPKWKAHFVAYYEVSRDIWLKAALFLATALGLAVALFVIEGHAEQLKNMQVAADATMLDTARAIHVGGLVIWLTILFVSWRSAVDTKRKVCDES